VPEGQARPSGAVLVRTFATADEPAVVALWRVVFPDGRPWNAPEAIVARKCAQADGLFWVAILDGVLVGAMIAGYDGQRGWIYHLAVAPEARRRGVGRALVAEAERALAARGCPKVNLQVLPSNREVTGFYARLGWQVEERVSMGKTLAGQRPGQR
jgi:ribosomal protein S18 acetylase RimI-like enzyme